MADAPSSNLTALTWNCEGIKANIYTLMHFLVQHTPDLCFLSEPQLFSTDAHLIKKAMADEYRFFLNSEDLYKPDLLILRIATTVFSFHYRFGQQVEKITTKVY